MINRIHVMLSAQNSNHWQARDKWRRPLRPTGGCHCLLTCCWRKIIELRQTGQLEVLQWLFGGVIVAHVPIACGPQAAAAAKVEGRESRFD